MNDHNMAYEEALFLLESAIKIWSSGQEEKFPLAHKKWQKAITIYNNFFHEKNFENNLALISEWD